MNPVDFMIIGAMKCGTTTLSTLLASHPQVAFCDEKEPHYFGNHVDWRHGLESYHKLFDQDPQKIRGEGSVSYTMLPRNTVPVWDSLHDYNPDLKLIYIMRNPIERIVSHYMHVYLREIVDGSLEDAIHSYYGILHFTKYWSQIAPFLNRFNHRQVLLLRFDRLLNARDDTLLEVADFLKIDPGPFLSMPNVAANKSVGQTKPPRNSGGFRQAIPKLLWRRPTRPRLITERPTLSADWQKILLTYLEPEISGIEAHTSWDLADWRKIS